MNNSLPIITLTPMQKINKKVNKKLVIMQRVKDFIRNTKLLTIMLTIVGLVASNFTFAQISGIVYKDFDGNGKISLVPYEPGVEDQKVKIFIGNNTVPIETVTDENGEYSFTALQAPKDSLIRIEFVLADGYFDAFTNNARGTSVQFIKAPATNLNLGIMSDDEWCVEGKGLTVTTPCYVNGDPLKGGTAGTADAIVMFPYKASGVASPTNFPPAHLAITSEVGSLWSSAYQKVTKSLLFGAIVRRHSGLGPLGTGGIYNRNMATGVISTFIDVKNLGIDTGPDPHKRPGVDTTDLPKNMLTANHDSLAFQMAGKVGFAGMQLTRYADTLMLVNLYDRKLYSFKVSKPLVVDIPMSKASVKSYNIPHPNCSNNEFRPWALKHRRGKMYLGVVCSAETSQNVSDLKAAVYTFDPKTETFTKILDIPLNYKRDPADNSGPDCKLIDKWLPWTNKFPEQCNKPSTYRNIVYPQPILADIDFDDDESMLLGFVDRLGLQAGQQNWGIAKNDTLKYDGFMSGDILRAQYKKGVYTLENNGKSGKLTGCGVGKGTGPGGGEFFCDDEWIFFGQPGHQEITNGGLFKQPGKREILSSAMDPVDSVFKAAGFRLFSATTGKKIRSYALYADQPGTLGKAGGTGDLTGMCDPAVLEIGNRVWLDKNLNGVQDGNEKGLDNLIITLHDMTLGGVLVAKDTTASDGTYYFNDLNVPGGLKRKSKYEIRLALNQKIPKTILAPANARVEALDVSLKDTLQASPQFVVTGVNANIRDSDGAYSTDGTMLVIKATTGDDGENDHTFDIGLGLQDPRGTIGDYVWKDTNNNGKQDDGNTGVAGVQLEIYKAVAGSISGAAIAKDTTDTTGKYLFTNLPKGDYIVKLLTNTIPVTCVLSDSTNKGADDKDNDFTKAGLSPVVILDPANVATNALLKDNLTIDAALVVACVKPVFNLTPQAAVCNGTTAGTAQILVTNIGNATAYVFGTDTTTFSFPTTTNVVGSSFTIPNITNPTTPKTCYVRIYNGLASCYVTKMVVIQPTNCTLPCVKPSFTLTPQSATCSGTTANADAKILVTGAANGLSYNYGSDTTTFTFASAVAYTGNSFAIANIANPAANKNCYVRIYNGAANCYLTKMVVLKPTTCVVSCIKPTFTLTSQAASCNGTVAGNAQIFVSSAANGLTYNYGTDTTTFSLASSTAYSGNSFTISNIPNPASAKNCYIRIYNGASNCYLTKMVVIQPTNCTASCVKPSFTVNAYSATCNGTTARNNAQVIVSGSSNGMMYSFGTDTTTFSYASAAAYAGAGFTISNLPNETLPKTYYVRIYGATSACYLTKKVIIYPISCQNPPIDIELKKEVIGSCFHNYGDEFQYKIKITNKATDPSAIADSVWVSDTLAANFTLVSAKASQGVYLKSKSTWGMLRLEPGQTDSLVITVKLTTITGTEGYMIENKAEVIKHTGTDIDSKPNNHSVTEDDYASAIITIPIKICPIKKDTVTLTAPSGFTSYQWCLNGVNIQGATQQTYEVAKAGEYTVKVNGNNCPTKSCCPMKVIEECICPPDICVPYIIKKTKSRGVKIK
jgi:SdrD B-like domain/Domain of unknown function DUF11